MFLIISLLLALFIPTKASCHTTHYKQFNMDPADITAVLNDNTQYAAPALTSTPTDICFGCADVKYDHGVFKIVECGDGIYMSLRAADVIMNNNIYNLVAPYWGLLWHFLAQFKLPIWLVESIYNKNALAIDTSKKLGVRFMPSFEALEKDAAFQMAMAKNSNAGIIVFAASPLKEHHRDGATYKAFRKKYPQFICLNSTTRDYLKKKDATYQLFQRAGLSHFVPTFGIFSTKYNPTTTTKIKALLPDSELIVIKPTYSSLSCGVNVIEADQLDSFLKLILQTPHNIPDCTHRGLSFWRNTKQAHFVASEYVPSQTIYKDGKPYDPTMRMVYIMYHDQGVIRVNILGGYWKIPVKPLNANKANHTAKHVTIAHAGDYFSFGQILEHKESLRMKQVMAPVLAKAYEQMLLLGKNNE